MKQLLKPNTELDILSGDEYAKGQLKLIEAIRSQSKRPAIRTLDTAQGISDGATGLLILRTASPPPGRVWEVRRATICSATSLRSYETLTTGLFIYKSREAPDAFLDATVTIPNVSTWEAEQLLLYPGDVLLCIIVDTSVSLQYAVTIQGVDWDLNISPVGVK